MYKYLKLHLISMAKLSMDPVTICDVKRVPCSDDPTDNYHPVFEFFQINVLVLWHANIL